MASVSVVDRQPGPHRLDSDTQILLLQLHTSKRTIPPTWEKMVIPRSCDSVTTGEEGRAHPAALGLAVMPGVGCGVPAALDAPRSPNQEEGSGGVTAADGRDSSRDAGGRSRGSLLRDTNGPAKRHKKSHRHRDALHATRDRRSADAAASPPGGLPGLERLTQGRTGVVKLARAEPHRREAWSIFPRETDPRVRTETGQGHRFENTPVKQDWCDACSRQVTAQALKCQSK